MIAIDAEERPSGTRGGVVVRIASAIEPEWLIDIRSAGVREELVRSPGTLRPNAWNRATS